VSERNKLRLFNSFAFVGSAATLTALALLPVGSSPFWQVCLLGASAGIYIFFNICIIKIFAILFTFCILFITNIFINLKFYIQILYFLRLFGRLCRRILSSRAACGPSSRVHPDGSHCLGFDFKNRNFSLFLEVIFYLTDFVIFSNFFQLQPAWAHSWCCRR
jgi:hypothetical protein